MSRQIARRQLVLFAASFTLKTAGRAERWEFTLIQDRNQLLPDDFVVRSAVFVYDVLVVDLNRTSAENRVVHCVLLRRFVVDDRFGAQRARDQAVCRADACCLRTTETAVDLLQLRLRIATVTGERLVQPLLETSLIHRRFGLLVLISRRSVCTGLQLKGVHRWTIEQALLKHVRQLASIRIQTAASLVKRVVRVAVQQFDV